MGTQQQAKFPRVGVIANGSPDTLFEALRQSFAQHGYIEGSNIVIEARFAHGHSTARPNSSLNWSVSTSILSFPWAPLVLQRLRKPTQRCRSCLWR